jgi:hypothetical protein
MLEGLSEAAFASHALPADSTPAKVEGALRLLADCSPETEQEAYSRVLFAVGNNHGGSYRPVVLPVLPFLHQILREGSSSARETTLNVLIDLISSFDPEVGFEKLNTSSGSRLLVDLLWEGVAVLMPLVRERAKAESASQRERRLALELVEFFEAG